MNLLQNMPVSKKIFYIKIIFTDSGHPAVARHLSLKHDGQREVFFHSVLRDGFTL